MRYLLLIYVEEALEERMGEAEMGELMQDYGRFTEEIEAAGVVLASERLRPVSSATTSRRKEGKTTIFDGPFAETKEALGGFYLIEVADLDAANAWAAKVPSVSYGCIEVRPIWDMGS